MNAPGIYGKLPTHGDFLQRNLPSSFVDGWDNWLQQFISGSKEQIGADWLDVYLTSPIWRFVLSPGVIDEHPWAGILMPSVDLVGRYFPFTVSLQLSDATNPSEFIATQTQWFCDIEEISLHSLDGEYEVDELTEMLSAKSMDIKMLYTPDTKLLETFDMHYELEFEEQSASAIYPHVADVLLKKLLKSYSIWSTSGSERIAPCVITTKHLPAVSKIPAMLNGEWQRWGWQEPYSLDDIEEFNQGNVAI